MRDAMPLKDRARLRTSGGPASGSARTPRSPAANPSFAARSNRMGRVTDRENTHPISAASSTVVSATMPSPASLAVTASSTTRFG